MASILSPYRIAIVHALGRRFAWRGFEAAGRLVCAANIALAALVPMLAASQALATVAMGIRPPPGDDASISWAFVALAILAWTAFDSWRHRQYLAALAAQEGLSTMRPFRSLALMASSGFILGTLRFAIWAKPNFAPFDPQAPRVELPDFWPDFSRSNSPWRDGSKWLALASRPWPGMARQAIPASFIVAATLAGVGMARQAIPASFIVAATLAGVGLALAFAIPAALEALVAYVFRACSGASLGGLRSIGETLAAEGQADLARAEAKALDGAADAQSSTSKPPRL
jgi:hypothetical protein